MGLVRWNHDGTCYDHKRQACNLCANAGAEGAEVQLLPPPEDPLGIRADMRAEVDDTNPKDRIGVTKVPMLSVLSSASLIHEALAMQNGAKKYGAFNWREKRVKASVYADAAMRHLMSYFDGQNVDKDSGLHPLAHAKACCGILLDALETGNLVDDRPTPGAGPDLLEYWRRKQK